MNSDSTQSRSSAAGSNQLVIVAMVIAVVAVILVNIYTEMRAKQSRLQVSTYFRLKYDVDSGHALEMRDLDLVRVPTLYADAFKTMVREVEGRGEPYNLGQPLTQAVAKGEFLLKNHFLDEFSTGSRYQPDVGKRIFAFKVNSEQLPASLAPGAWIDVYGQFYGAGGKRASQVVLERVKIIEIGAFILEHNEFGTTTTSQQSPRRYSKISIELDPVQVIQMMNIQNQVINEEFKISLRNTSDRGAPLIDEPSEINPDVLRQLDLD